MPAVPPMPPTPAIPVPVPTPESRPYWDAAARGELAVQRCVTTGRHFLYPRLYSPFVTGGAVEWVTASGRGTLHSYNILYRPAPGYQDRTPYAVAIVELAEGPRLMSNIVNVENTPENLVLDMPLQVVFEDRGGVSVPVFEPAGTRA